MFLGTSPSVKKFIVYKWIFKVKYVADGTDDKLEEKFVWATMQ